MRCGRCDSTIWWSGWTATWPGNSRTRLTIDEVAIGQSNSVQRLLRSAVRRVPFKFNVTISGPFRSLIATAKSMQDPRNVIRDVLPVPIDQIPGVVTEVRRREEAQDMQQTPNRPITIEVVPNPRATASHAHEPSSIPHRRRRARSPCPACVTVRPPDKPIEINLNVKIEQEVLVRLQRDVDQLIRSNPDVFPTTPQPATPPRNP